MVCSRDVVCIMQGAKCRKTDFRLTALAQNDGGCMRVFFSGGSKPPTLRYLSWVFRQQFALDNMTMEKMGRKERIVLNFQKHLDFVRFKHYYINDSVYFYMLAQSPHRQTPLSTNRKENKPNEKKTCSYFGAGHAGYRVERNRNFLQRR